MPVVVRIARQLYLQRIEEVKEKIKQEQTEFGQLAEEIQAIKSGKWDNDLKGEAQLQQEICIKRTSSEINLDTNLKRCRLEEQAETSTNEEQVIATAISTKSPTPTETSIEQEIMPTSGLPPPPEAAAVTVIGPGTAVEMIKPVVEVTLSAAATAPTATPPPPPSPSLPVAPLKDMIENPTSSVENRLQDGKTDKLPRIIIPELYNDQSGKNAPFI